MRPLPTWPTNTFQSPKLATREGLAASWVFSDLGAALALDGFVSAAAGGRGGACGHDREPDRAKG